MFNRFYKKSDVINGKFFKPPRFLKVDFTGIEFREIVIQDGDRLDIIAQQLYQDPNLWRVLALFNDLSYFFELQAGDILRIPTKIDEALNRI